MIRVLKIRGENDQVRKDVYDFLVGGRFREITKVEQITPNYVRLTYVPKFKA